MKASYSLARHKAGVGGAIFFFLCLCSPGSVFPQGFSLPANVSNLPNQLDTLPSIAIDKDNHVHIAWNGFYAKAGAPDGVAGDIFYTNNVSGTFSTPVMIPVSESWYSRDIDIAVDSAGHAHIVFRRSPSQMSVTWDDDIYYVSNVGGSFGQAQKIVDGTLSSSPGSSSPYEPHIHCDSQDRIHITFTSTGSYLMAMNNVSGQWSQPVIAFQGSIASGYASSLDKGDHLHVAFSGTLSIMDSTRIYYVNDVSGNFSTAVAVSSPTHSSSMSPGIAIDSNGKVHIVYRAPFVTYGTPYLFYVNNVSGGFDTVIPIGNHSGLNTPSYIPAITIDKSDIVHIAYKEFPAYGGALQYGTYANGAFIFNSCNSMGDYWYPGARYLVLGQDSTPHFAFYDFMGDVYASDTEIFYLTIQDHRSVTTTAVVGRSVTFSAFAQSLTLTATIAGPTVNQGTVTFQVMDGTSIIGAAVTSGTVTGGAASVTYVLPGGTAPKNYTVLAAYSGGLNFQASSGTGTLNVAPDANLTMTFNLPPEGGSTISSGLGALSVIYGQMSSTASTNPVAIANFGYSTKGVAGTALVSEAGIPAAAIIRSARLFVDYTTDTNSGFGLVNPGNSAITINADIKNATGTTIGSVTVHLGPRGHTAMFANQLMPTLPNPFLGTITLTSVDGFAAVNLSTAMSGRREMLFSALPVADLANPPVGARSILSQIVDGGGNPTQILLMNPSGTSQSNGRVQLFDDTGAPLALDFGSLSGPQSSLDFLIAPDGMAKFATSGKGSLRVGYAVVTVSSGQLPVGNSVFQFNQTSGLVSQAGVTDSPPTTSARMYVEVTSAPLNRNTGIAIVNPNAIPSTLTLTLNGFNGSSQVATLNLGPNEHTAKFITQLFAGLPTDFRGVLNVTGSQPNSFLTLRLTVNERGESIYSTLPVADLNNPPRGIQILPQIVNGGGYTTQIIVISTSTGPGAVYIDFFDETGGSIPLTSIQ